MKEQTRFRIQYEDDTFALWLELEGQEVSPWKEKEPIFVCGRLMEPSFLTSVIGRPAAMAPAVAVDCSRAWENYKGKPYIFLKKSKGWFVPGMVFLGLSAEERSRLTKFEEVDTVRKIEEVTLRVGERQLQGISFFKR
jgi:hypothetical protein